VSIADLQGPGPLEIARVRDARTARVSSWDHGGRNQDNWIIGPGETRVLADLEGPGCITHIWMTQFCRRVLGPGLIDPLAAATAAPVLEIHNALGLNWEEADPDYYRKVLLRITWDDQPHPSVLAPLGDFFCIGHSMPASFASAAFTVSAKPEESLRFGGSASVNCYLPMPFSRRALIEVVNENDVPYGQYFHIDYELYRRPLPEDVGYLHAQWRRENPCRGWAPDIQVNSPETNAANLGADGNYVVLEAEGAGHFVGCNLSVFHRQGSWWGEGDDMIFVDGEEWPPSLHGTGTEDYFNHAWGMQRNAFPYHGAIVHESDVPSYAVSYRFHVVDPIRFSSSLRVTIEHGHANHLSDDWASTAYWYQLLPSKPFGIAPRADRLPPRLGPEPPSSVNGLAPGTEEAERLHHTYRQRTRDYLALIEQRAVRRSESSVEHAERNREHAARIRGSFR
jgi:hypothetical protein